MQRYSGVTTGDIRSSAGHESIKGGSERLLVVSSCFHCLLSMVLLSAERPLRSQTEIQQGVQSLGARNELQSRKHTFPGEDLVQGCGENSL